MLNNPDNLAPEDYLGQAQRPEDRCYIQFGYEDFGPCGLRHTLYRVIWDRDNVPSLTRDFRWFHYESPEWLTQ
jgi:hypothetical protein